MRFGGRWDLIINGWDQARKFAKLVGFRVSYRREMLEDLLRIRQLPAKQRYRWWTTHYEKVNGRWRKKKNTSPSPHSLKSKKEKDNREKSIQGKNSSHINTGRFENRENGGPAGIRTRDLRLRRLTAALGELVTSARSPPYPG